MSHPYDKSADCQCVRCVKERERRAVQAASNVAWQVRAQRTKRKARYTERVASREEQHARYIDCGPQAWDDRDGGP